MKKTILVLLGLVLFIMPSCVKGDNPDSFNMALVTVLTHNENIPDNSYPYYFLGDDSTVYYPGNYTAMTGWVANDMARAILYFNDMEMPSSGGITTGFKNKTIEVIQINEVQSLGLTSTSQIDTIANSYINPTAIWMGGGAYDTPRCLNMEFEFIGSGERTHLFYVVDDKAQANPDADGYYHLYFRHDLNNDRELETYSVIVSFPVPDEIIASGAKGLRITLNPLYAGSSDTYSLKF